MGLVFGDYFDFVSDEKLARQLKRKRLGFAVFKINPCSHSLKTALKHKWSGKGIVDEEYKTFLNNLVEYFESKQFLREDSYNGEDIDERDDMDPQYKMFLENFKEDGNSYVLKTIHNKVPLSVKYEAEDGWGDEHELPSRRKLRKIQDTEEMEAARNLRNLRGNAKMETQKNLRSVVSKVMMDSAKEFVDVIGTENRDLVVEKDLESGPRNHVSGKTNGYSCQNPGPKGNNSFKVGSEHEKGADMMDADYLTFLHGLKEEDGWYIFATEDGKQVTYEGPVVQESSDSEVFMTDNASDLNEGHYKPFETSRLFDSFLEEDEQQCLGSANVGKISVFREKLIGKLREPYQHKEYEKLWQIITERTPKNERHRDLRGRAALKSYPKNDWNPSYLEHYTCLKRKIDAAKFDRLKVLNLLRGFFFWLENLVYEDAFLPWLDPSCLAVMPTNR